jgi:hypothetical protein
MKIKFTEVLIEKISNEYYNIYMYNLSDIVYKYTCDSKEACKIAMKYKNVKTI